MRKSGLADSPFFSKSKDHKGATPLPDKDLTLIKNRKVRSRIEKKQTTRKPSNRDTTIPRNHDTTVSRYHDTIIEIIRRAVKDFGKEAATHRFTIAEKKAIGDIIFSFKGKDIKTSENEITRIAVNFIIQDYKEKGSKSILERSLKALNE